MKSFIFNIFLSFNTFTVIVSKYMSNNDTTLEIMSSPWELDYRLPSWIYPKHYDLFLFPNFINGNLFTGHVTILVETSREVDYLLAHIKYLEVTRTIIKREDGSEVDVNSVFEYTPNEFWVMTLAKKIPMGNYSIYLEFKGRLDNGIVGFYKSTYVDSHGKKRSIATSKFQPTYARRAFPCFDEPTFKSTFSTTLVRPSKGYIAISNMMEESSMMDFPEKGFTSVTFGKSVPMVTYLAIFAVVDFDYIEKYTKVNSNRFRVYGTKDQINNNVLNYSLEIGSHITDYYETYFDLKYPLPKLDMAAIPDYSSGATEHWGLITYREANLIYEEGVSSSNNKVRVASVIAHELAHQWFGNLMTVSWWNDLWLNEGFATYIQYKGVKSYEKDWDMDSAFLTKTLHSVMDLDATKGTHPIVVDVDTPDQINAVFDAISYNKGSSVIRMMEMFLGSTNFKNGVSNFLKKFAFKNAVTKDLFDELQKVVSNLDITKIMNTWTKQEGYPVINIERENGKLILTQKRFMIGSSIEFDDSEYKWEVPVTFISSSSNDTTLKWLHVEDEQIEVPINKEEWIKFNVEQRGYYRINYPLSDWQQFGDLLKENPKIMSSSDKTGLLNDAFALANAEQLDYTVALNLTAYLANEMELAPWTTVLSELARLNHLFYYSPEIRGKLNAYELNLVSDLYNTLGGWNDNDVSDTLDIKLLKIKILDLACTVGHKDALNQASLRFREWMKSNGEKKLNPDFQELIYIFGMKTSIPMLETEKNWKFLFQVYKNETNAQKKISLLKGLSVVQDPGILNEFIHLAKDTENIREQDYFTALTLISFNPIGTPLIWDFVRNQWEYLVERFTLNNRLLGWFIRDLTSQFTSPLRLQEMKDFFANNPEAGAGASSRIIALESVENNIKFLDKYSQKIKDWLSLDY